MHLFLLLIRDFVIQSATNMLSGPTGIDGEKGLDGLQGEMGEDIFGEQGQKGEQVSPLSEQLLVRMRKTD